jgi:SAM-dependent methyltransferase
MNFLKRWVLAFVAPRPLVGVLYLPRFVRDYFRFRARTAGAARPHLAETYPCLVDWVASTPFDPHYFYQGAWLARNLSTRPAALHVDVGSSVMMLSVITAWAPTAFVDVRPLRAGIAGLFPIAGTLAGLPFADRSVTSLSCLHVIEHVGLGRYGDPLDPAGARAAAAELARVLAPGGRLYLSTPVGRERVCFNAHRVFSPHTIRDWFSGFHLAGFSYVDDSGAFHAKQDPAAASGLEYGCGMFIFERPA